MNKRKASSDSLFLENFIYRIDSSRTFSALRRGLIMTLPIILIGSIFSFILSFPVVSVRENIKTVLDGSLYNILNWFNNATLSLISLFIILTISYSYGRQVTKNFIGFYPLCSLCVYIIMLSDAAEMPSIEIFGFTYSFSAIITAILACHVLHLFMGRMRRFKFMHYYKEGIAPDFQSSVMFILPFALTLLFFVIIRVLLLCLFNSFNLPSTVEDSGIFLLTRLFEITGTGFGGTVLYVFLEGLLSFFGMPGSNMLGAVLVSSYLPQLMENAAAVEAGTEIPNICNLTFMDSFVFLGGAGCTLCLALAILIGYSKNSSRFICAISAVPSAFNMSEIMIYGLPVILNPMLFVPFILTPIATFLISYAATALGLAPYVTHYVHWATPVFLNSYLATGSVRSILLQAFCLVVGTLIYLPFVRLSEKYSQRALCKNFEHLTRVVKDNESTGKSFSSANLDRKSRRALQILKNDLRFALNHNMLELHYQPQITSDGTLYGVESLLRWKHRIAGYIYPPLIINAAIDDNLIDDLGMRIIALACHTLNRLGQRTNHPISLSVNISPVQLENEDFCKNVRDIYEKYNFGENKLCFEVTEQIALVSTAVITSRIEELQSMGILFHMDDFGMGHSSMTYLQNNVFSAVKLDGNLIKEILNNVRAQNIVMGINQMSHSLNCDVIAEYVETSEQQSALNNMGCTIYQGFLYSKALPLAQLEKFLQEHNMYAEDTQPIEKEELYI